MVHKWVLRGLLFSSIALVQVECFKLTWVDYTPTNPELQLIRNALELSRVVRSDNARKTNVTLLAKSKRAPEQVLLYCNYPEVYDNTTTTYFYAAFTFKYDARGVVIQVHLHAAAGFLRLENTPLTPAHTNVVLTAAETYRGGLHAYKPFWETANTDRQHDFRKVLVNPNLPNWNASQYCVLENYFIAMFYIKENDMARDDDFFAIFEKHNTDVGKLIKLQFANVSKLHDKIAKTLGSGLAFSREFKATESDQPAPDSLYASKIPWIDNIQNARLHGTYDTKQGYIFEMYKSFGSLESTFFVLYKGKTVPSGKVLHVSLPAPVSKTVKIFQKLMENCQVNVEYRCGIGWLNQKFKAVAIISHEADISSKLEAKHGVPLTLEEIGILPMRELNTKMYCVTYNLNGNNEGWSALLEVVGETAGKEQVAITQVSKREWMHIMVANYYRSSKYVLVPVSADPAEPRLPKNVTSSLPNALAITYCKKNDIEHLFTVAYGEASSRKVRLVACNFKPENSNVAWLGQEYSLTAVDGKALDYKVIQNAQLEGENFSELMHSNFPDISIISWVEDSWTTTGKQQPNMIWDVSEKFKVKIYADFTSGVKYRYEIWIPANVSDSEQTTTSVVKNAAGNKKYENIITSKVFNSSINLLSSLLQFKVRQKTVFQSPLFFPKITEAVDDAIIKKDISDLQNEGYTVKTSIFLDNSLDKIIFVFAHNVKNHRITQYLNVGKKDLNAKDKGPNFEYKKLRSTYADESVVESALASILGDPFAFDIKYCWTNYDTFPTFEVTEASTIFDHAPWKVERNEIFRVAERSVYKEIPDLIITICSLDVTFESETCFYVFHKVIQGDQGPTKKFLKVSGLGSYFTVIEAYNSFLRLPRKFTGIDFNNGTTWMDPLAATDLLKPVHAALHKLTPGAQLIEDSYIVGEISVPITDVIVGNVISLVVVGQLRFHNGEITYATLIVKAQADTLDYIETPVAETHSTTFPCEYDIESYLQTRYNYTNLTVATTT